MYFINYYLLKKHFLLFSMLKTVVLLNIIVQTVENNSIYLKYNFFVTLEMYLLALLFNLNLTHSKPLNDTIMVIFVVVNLWLF